MNESAEAVRLLRELTEAHGVPGSEGAIREIFVKELTGLGGMTADKLGGVVCDRGGEGPRVLVAGHFDEVGFSVQSITGKGFIKLVALGGWWSHTLVAQRVRILTSSGREVPGVIGSTPPHFLSDGARDKLLTLDQMFVDVGAGSRQEVLDLGIRLGDPVAPSSSFTELAVPGTYMAKAFDNRCGVAAAIQSAQLLADRDLRCRLLSAGSVQEEVGCRGAVTLGELTRPDVALVLEGTPADDTPGLNGDEAQGELGKGVQIRVLDPTAIMNRKLVDLAVETAETEGIPHQVAVRKSGGTDAKSLQFAGSGVPCVVLGTPARYIHSHNSLIRISDYLAMLRLVCAMAQRLDAAMVSSLNRWI